MTRYHKNFTKGGFKQTTSTIAEIMGSAGDFTTGFIGMMGDAVNAFMGNKLLMLFMFAIPLSLGAVAFVRGLIKKRRR